MTAHTSPVSRAPEWLRSAVLSFSKLRYLYQLVGEILWVIVFLESFGIGVFDASWKKMSFEFWNQHSRCSTLGSVLDLLYLILLNL